jgi:hypothetical protein
MREIGADPTIGSAVELGLCCGLEQIEGVAGGVVDDDLAPVDAVDDFAAGADAGGSQFGVGLVDVVDLDGPSSRNAPPQATSRPRSRSPDARGSRSRCAAAATTTPATPSVRVVSSWT